MSDVKTDNQGSTPGTEGRMLSRTRRQALSHGGKAALAQTQNAKPVVRGHVRPPVPARGASPAPIQARVESAARPAKASIGWASFVIGKLLHQFYEILAQQRLGKGRPEGTG